LEAFRDVLKSKELGIGEKAIAALEKLKCM
jgi:hypothetical protein